MDNPNTSVPPKAQTWEGKKRSIKRMSNIFSVSLICEQFIAIFAVIIAFAVGFLFQIGILNGNPLIDARMISQRLKDYNNYPLFGFLMLLVYFIYMFIPFAIIATVLKQNPFRVISFKFKRKDLILPLVLIGVFASIVGQFYSNIFEIFLSGFNLEVNLDAFDLPNNNLSLFIYFLSVSVFAPICEEFIFRGLIMQNLRKFGDFFAIFVSAMAFGILHGNFIQTPFAFVVGLALGFAVVETGSLFTGIIIHFLINTISTVFSILSSHLGEANANTIYFIYAGAMFIAAVLTLIYLIKKKNFFKGITDRYFKKDILTHRAFTTFIKTPGFIFFAIVFGLSMFLVLKTIG